MTLVKLATEDFLCPIHNAESFMIFIMDDVKVLKSIQNKLK